MCRYCRDLTKDKDIVHSFVARAAKRASDIVGVKLEPDDLTLDFGHVAWSHDDAVGRSQLAPSVRDAQQRSLATLFL